MRRSRKVSLAIEHLVALGFARRSCSWPHHRLLWHWGFEVAPPHFAGLLPNFGASALGVGLLAALVSLGASLVRTGGVDEFRASDGLITGAIAGVLVSLSYWESSRRVRLPKWEHFDPEGAQRKRRVRHAEHDNSP